MKFKRLPKHIAVIPDGNRRWAEERGLPRSAGYAHGIGPAVELYDLCISLGIEEISLYGFTQDNTKRPTEQRIAFQEACVEGVKLLMERDAALLVVGDTSSPMFPEELVPLTKRRVFGRGLLKVNFLVNYDWHWDLACACPKGNSRQSFIDSIGSADVSRIDLVIRWGGRRRLSGLLPVQAVYADFYVLDALWPDFTPEHLFDALRWYDAQDVTLGG
ncbi:MAG: undecaprenyl diphosphate synthase family protein [Armatimonadota bacterium]